MNATVDKIIFICIIYPRLVNNESKGIVVIKKIEPKRKPTKIDVVDLRFFIQDEFGGSISLYVTPFNTFVDASSWAKQFRVFAKEHSKDGTAIPLKIDRKRPRKGPRIELVNPDNFGPPYAKSGREKSWKEKVRKHKLEYWEAVWDYLEGCMKEQCEIESFVEVLALNAKSKKPFLTVN